MITAEQSLCRLVRTNGQLSVRALYIPLRAVVRQISEGEGRL
jgi:hypothetical protein